MHISVSESDMEEAWQAFHIAENPPPAKEINAVYFCHCGGVKVTTNNMPTCSNCGRVDRVFVDETAEWTTGGEEKTGPDPARCGMPADNELFSEQWGAGLVINSKGASYEVRRMAKISFHSSMNHKDRSLFHAYKDIESAASGILNLPSTVIRDAKVMYKTFNGKKLTRGAVRIGVKANCVFLACQLAKIPRTTKEIADAFGITPNDISRTTVIFREVFLGEKKNEQAVAATSHITRPVDVLPRLLNDITIDEETKRKVRIQCNKLARRLEPCIPLMSKTPTSIAAAIISCVLGTSMPKKEICAACKISVPTMNKIEVIVKNFIKT
jgi:transcription initiation factor TFIIB